MADVTSTHEERAIRIQTADGAVDGLLLTSPGSRTLDDLNVSRRFVTLHAPANAPEDWQLGSSPLAVSKRSILFVHELAPPPPRSGSRFGAFTRSAVHLRVGGFEIDGFVHVPPGGVPLKRLEQDGHDFVSLTSVLLCGLHAEQTLPFLAVNRCFVTTAQATTDGDSDLAVSQAGATAES